MANLENKNVVSQNELENTVSAQGQTRKIGSVRFWERDGKMKVLVVGNSITWHSVLPSIGWYGEWGMAASCADKAFLQRLMVMLEKEYGTLDFCMAQLAEWEMKYPEGTPLLEEKFASARDFGADVIVIRIGENFPKGLVYDADVKAYFSNMIKFLRSNENAKVVVTDSFWKNAGRDTMLREIAEENGYTFCQINDIEDDPNTMALNDFEHRGVRVHPSDLGMERIADRIFASLKSIL